MPPARRRRHLRAADASPDDSSFLNHHDRAPDARIESERIRRPITPSKEGRQSQIENRSPCRRLISNRDPSGLVMADGASCVLYATNFEVGQQFENGRIAFLRKMVAEKLSDFRHYHVRSNMERRILQMSQQLVSTLRISVTFSVRPRRQAGNPAQNFRLRRNQRFRFGFSCAPPASWGRCVRAHTSYPRPDRRSHRNRSTPPPDLPRPAEYCHSPRSPLANTVRVLYSREWSPTSFR